MLRIEEHNFLIKGAHPSTSKGRKATKHLAVQFQSTWDKQKVLECSREKENRSHTKDMKSQLRLLKKQH